jgi:hypothetical protein
MCSGLKTFCLRGFQAWICPVDGGRQFRAVWGLEALDQFGNAVQPRQGFRLIGEESGGLLDDAG